MPCTHVEDEWAVMEATHNPRRNPPKCNSDCVWSQFWETCQLEYVPILNEEIAIPLLSTVFTWGMIPLCMSLRGHLSEDKLTVQYTLIVQYTTLNSKSCTI